MLISGTVKDVFAEGFESVHEDKALSECLALFKDKKLPALAVFDSKGKHVGMLSPRWIIRSRLDPTTTNAKALMRRAPKVNLSDSLSKVAKLMIESGIRKLPVYSGDKLLGFVTEVDVIQGAVMEKWGNTEVEEIMTRNPLVVEEDESVGRLLSLFREQEISHAPVVSRGKLVGIVSIRDIIEYVFQPRRRQTVGEMAGKKISSLGVPVKGIMSNPVITVLPENHVRYAAEKMREFDISSLVVTTNGRPTGILTKRDFLEPMAQMKEVERKLTIQFSVRDDVEMDEVQQSSIIDDFQSLARRYEETLEAGTLFVYMKPHGTNFSGHQLIHCRLKLRTRKGSFFSNSEGWNVGETFRRALDRLDRQILGSKELEYDQKFAKRYLQRIRFPLTEL